MIEALADAMCLYSRPEHTRCNNNPKMIAMALRKPIAQAGAPIQSITPGSS